MRTVLVTGGGGFIASWLMPALTRRGWKVRATIRDGTTLTIPGVEPVAVESLSEKSHWPAILGDAEAVVHLAGRAHRMNEGLQHAHDYVRDNTRMTEALGQAAARAGVRCLVFASSVKVLGERTEPGQAWTESSPCRPLDPYGLSKLQAEEALRRITGLKPIILRLPLVYGPGVKGNMRRLWGLVRRGIPLPLASVVNQRSLLFVGNFTDVVIQCLEASSAVGHTFMTRDGEDLSTPELIRRIARAQGREARLWPAPPKLLRMFGRLTGKSGTVERLVDSLVVDDGATRRVLGWVPAFTVDDGLAAMAEALR